MESLKYKKLIHVVNIQLSNVFQSSCTRKNSSIRGSPLGLPLPLVLSLPLDLLVS